ncbi:MAG: hypothetical protein J6Y28_02960 [Acholeplasmatales bacterium]|nr:hypothetical protein [Acholeplasmatales bacterium]
MKSIGYINTRCTSNGTINLYGLPNKLHCYSFDLHRSKLLYTGLNSIELDDIDDKLIKDREEIIRNSSAVLVMNNWDRVPTEPTMTLFAQRLALADRCSDTNVEAQRTPVMILVRRKSAFNYGKSL